MMNYLKSVLLVGLFAFGKPYFAQVNSDFEEVVDFSIPKNIYFTGEKIWLAVHVNSVLGPSSSRVVYAELWNRYGESVALAKLPLQEGVCFNFLQIPDELDSDNYLLRVFTRVSPYMNLETGLVQEFVTVFNPRVPPEVVAERQSLPERNDVSNLISLSKTTVQPGEQIEIAYSGQDSLLELTVAVPNPFLDLQGKVSSNDLYENLESRTLTPEFFGHIVEARIESDEPDTLASGLYYLSVSPLAN